MRRRGHPASDETVSNIRTPSTIPSSKTSNDEAKKREDTFISVLANLRRLDHCLRLCAVTDDKNIATMRHHRLASVAILACGLCVTSYMCLGGNDPGRTWFAKRGKAWLGDEKGGVVVIFIAFPILLAGSIASLFATTTSPSLQEPPQQLTTLGAMVSRWVLRWRYRSKSSGDWDVNTLAIVLIFIPSIIYLTMVNYRHFHGDQKGLDDQLMDAGNSFGIMAQVVGSFLLIPVSKHSPILKFFGWSPTRAVKLHIWAGRMFVIGGLVHGLFHMYRWFLAGESVFGVMIPPAFCWAMNTEKYNTFEPSCVDENTDCSCYDFFRNLTGVLSGLSILIIAITSLHEVRRKCYKVFYLSHIVAAPLALVMLVFHWNRSILFICPSLLYYAASSAAVMVENRTQCSGYKGVKVVAVERIPSLVDITKANVDNTMGSHYISLTMEATENAVHRFRPGYYVKLTAPEVSLVSHPFTINTVPGKSNQLRIIFKVIGKFTTELSHRIQDAAMLDQHDNLSSTVDKMPELYVNGYHGVHRRVTEVLQHDVSVMIAGGIGITPYLSLLHQVHDILVLCRGALPTKRILLLWVCRDSSLIDYVKREYLEPLLNTNNEDVDFKIKFVIYHTGEASSSPTSSYSDEEGGLDTHNDSASTVATKRDVLSMGLPFTPSRFESGATGHWRSNLLAFVSFFAIAWGGLISTWLIYTNYTTKDQIASRGWTLLVIALLSLGVAILANSLGSLSYFQDDQFAETEAFLSTENTDGLVRSSSPDDIEMDTLDHSEEQLGDGRQEMATGLSPPDGTVHNHSAVVSLEEKRGRPTVHQMLKFVDSARNPGVFTCGPHAMMYDIREQTKEKCLLRIQHCIRGASDHIALYEEAFEM